MIAEDGEEDFHCVTETLQKNEYFRNILDIAREIRGITPESPQ